MIEVQQEPQVHDLAFFVEGFTRISGDVNIQDPSVKQTASMLLSVCRLLQTIDPESLHLADDQRSALGAMFDTLPQGCPEPLNELLPQFIAWFRSL